LPATPSARRVLPFDIRHRATAACQPPSSGRAGAKVKQAKPWRAGTSDPHPVSHDSATATLIRRRRPLIPSTTHFCELHDLTGEDRFAISVRTIYPWHWQPHAVANYPHPTIFYVVVMIIRERFCPRRSGPSPVSITTRYTTTKTFGDRSESFETIFAPASYVASHGVRLRTNKERVFAAGIVAYVQTNRRHFTNFF
jgi:hypothetical protein